MKRILLEDKEVNVVIFADDGKTPFQIITDVGEDNLYFDVNNSKQYGLIYHMSGCGWMPNPEFIGSARPIWSNVDCLRGNIQQLPDNFQETINGMIESDAVYCAECDDWFPTDDVERECSHVFWCEECSWWSTPDERCDHNESKVGSDE